jgi:hypothetical protein
MLGHRKTHVEAEILSTQCASSEIPFSLRLLKFQMLMTSITVSLSRYVGCMLLLRSTQCASSEIPDAGLHPLPLRFPDM